LPTDTETASSDDDADVPELIWAIADRMHDVGIPTCTAVRMVRDMLTQAMDQPDDYLDQINVALH
jgi:hypothetical protein